MLNRATVVEADSHARPPGHPATLGASNGSWPAGMRPDWPVWLMAVVTGAPEALIMEMSHGTGARTRDPEASPASRIERMSGRICNPDAANSPARRSIRAGSTSGPSTARANLAVMNGAQAGWLTMASTTVSAS